MENEFNLKDKIFEYDESEGEQLRNKARGSYESIGHNNLFLEKDIKEFILNLKRELKKGVVLDCWKNMTIAQIKEQIDYIINQLYGEDLK